MAIFVVAAAAGGVPVIFDWRCSGKQFNIQKMDHTQFIKERDQIKLMQNYYMRIQILFEKKIILQEK